VKDFLSSLNKDSLFTLSLFILFLYKTIKIK